MAILGQLFLTFIFIGILNFGGGYAMIAFIQNQVVDVHGWLTVQEYTDMLAISQSTPGPVAVNTATYTGFKIGGIPGALLATFGLVVPAYFILLGLMYLLRHNPDNPTMRQIISGVRPMVVALTAGSAVVLAFENITSLYELALFLLSLLLLRKFNLNPIILVSVFGLWGIAYANLFEA
ncbi:MAG: chromate transporter [Firmicutes bacterium]|nr:chromate transporter [Bacillota bacterium]